MVYYSLYIKGVPKNERKNIWKPSGTPRPVRIHNAVQHDLERPATQKHPLIRVVGRPLLWNNSMFPPRITRKAFIPFHLHRNEFNRSFIAEHRPTRRPARTIQSPVLSAVLLCSYLTAEGRRFLSPKPWQGQARPWVGAREGGRWWMANDFILCLSRRGSSDPNVTALGIPSKLFSALGTKDGWLCAHSFSRYNPSSLQTLPLARRARGKGIVEAWCTEMKSGSEKWMERTSTCWVTLKGWENVPIYVGL